MYKSKEKRMKLCCSGFDYNIIDMILILYKIYQLSTYLSLTGIQFEIVFCDLSMLILANTIFSMIKFKKMWPDSRTQFNKLSQSFIHTSDKHEINFNT